MRLAVIATLVSALGASAAAAPRSGPWERLEAISDGKGHYLLLAPPRTLRTQDADGKEVEELEDALLWMGDGKRFFSVPLVFVKPGADGDLIMDFRDWRFPGPGSDGMQRLARAGERVTLRCGTGQSTFVPVDPKTRARIERSGSLAGTYPVRVPFGLYRDDEGRYYFIDRHDQQRRFYDKQLFVGRRGQLKRQALRDIVIDAAGELYIARAGTLKVVYDDKLKVATAWWRPQHGTAIPLTPIDENLHRSLMFIFGELGVYLGKKLGTPCDWL